MTLSHGRSFGPSLLALLTTVITWPAAGPVAAELPLGNVEYSTSQMLDDAELTDVFFLDPDQGWAVGDRGAILRTEDGGRHWQVQRVGGACRFESVHFIDGNLGWVVGGWIHPYTHRTSCVVFRTQDGGRNWACVPGLTLPALKKVRFLNAQQGWAVGNGSALYPTGIFRSGDGGRSWVPLPAGESGPWITADFRDDGHGVAAGHDGRLAVVSAPNVVRSKTPELGQRPLRAMRLPDGRQGWLVGDGGLVMQTADAGLSWQSPETPLPPGVSDLFDFHALSIVGSRIWIAGTPGSVMLHSADSGRTWELLRTDQRLPIHAVTFIDLQRGWAVGALGTILATRDGGRTWRRQRSGGTRMALFGVFSEAEQIPLELFALQSGDEGYLGFVQILNRRDIEVPSRDDAPLEDESQAAMSAVGACGADQAWRFPLRQNGLQLSSHDLTAIWDRVNDGHGVDLMEELIVRKIRQWRPEVIITEAASPRGIRPLSHVVNQIVLSAVRNAADATSHPDHATIAGLEPWAVKKVFCVAGEDDHATVTLTTAQLATRLGRSVAEHAADGYALVRSRYEASPVTVGFRLLQDGLPQSVGRKDIFSGIYLQPGGEARRQASQPAAQNLQSLARAAQKRRNIEQLFEKTSGGSSSAAAWLGQVQDLTSSLPASSAGQLLFQLGQRYRDAGRLELAAQSWEQLVERYPHHALSESALVWLVQYYASSEIGWQLQRQTRFSTQVSAASVIHAGVASSVQQADYEQTARESAPGGATGGATSVGTVSAGLKSAGGRTTAGVGIATSDRAARALKFAKMIQTGRPELFAEPWVQFPLAVAYRDLGMPRDAERFYHRLSSSPIPNDWERCGQSELWLAHGRGVPPKTTYVCKQGAARPRLDGQLDDHIWQNAERLELTSAQHDDGTWPAAAMLARDQQFLFLAVSCRKVPGRAYAAASSPRPRDGDVTDHDRVDLFIDLDRDYTSFYRLTVDQRGWTGESCMGDVHWNPTWYVASHTTDEDWTIEAAIALDELTASIPGKEDVWAIGLQRIVPGVGIQSCSKPAAVEPQAEGFSLMMFQ